MHAGWEESDYMLLLFHHVYEIPLPLSLASISNLRWKGSVYGIPAGCTWSFEHAQHIYSTYLLIILNLQLDTFK
jgi:hypothetical protein